MSRAKREQGQKSDKKFCVGIDIGGTKISSALFSSRGQMFSRKKCPIDKSHPEKPVFQVIEIIEELIENAGKRAGDVVAVGIVIPGAVFQESGLVWAPNIPGWDHFALREKIQDKIKLPLVLDSDRSAYVLGEQWCGIAKNKKDVVFLAVGTGIGAGISLDGKLYRGSEGVAGAVGWFALNAKFKKEYEQRGCFETEAAGDSIARKAIRAVESGESSIVEEMAGGNTENITAEIVLKAAQKNDPVAMKIVDSTIQYLSMGIANIVSALNPQMVVLGGGLFRSGELLLEPIREEFQKWAQPLAAQGIKIELSGLGEDAGLYGAGKLAWDSCTLNS
jgi:glucokinase